MALLKDRLSWRIKVIETFTRLGKKVYRLKADGGSYIDVVPEWGNSVIGFYLPYQNEALNVLYQPDDFMNQSGGIPVMWPFANRIKDGRFSRNGREHQILGTPFTTDDNRGNTIHGMVRKIPWQVVGSGTNDKGVYLSSRVIARDIQGIEQHFGQGVLTVTYFLKGNELAVLTEIENTGSRTFPMSWAFHPWFKAPLTDQGSRGEMIIQIPAAKRWEAKNNIPTGKLLPVENAFDFQEGKKLKNLEFDDVYTGLTLTQQNGKDVSVASIFYPQSGIDIKVVSDPVYKHLVFFAPLNKPTICIEPQTSPTNAFNMPNETSDLILLEPGKKSKAEFKISVSTMGEK